MLEKVKSLLGLTDTSKDNLLQQIILNATDEVKAFTHRDDISQLENTVCRIAVWQYNQLGTEGVATEGYNGASYTYADEYPEAILRTLRAYRKVRVI